MYQSSSSYVMQHNSLPSPDYTGDSDSESEFAQELTQKRRQLDEEVARFRAQKDKEFRDYEIELKSRRRQRRVQQHFLRNNNSYYHDFNKNSPSATPPASCISMLTGFEEKIQSPNLSHNARQSEPIRLMKSSASSKVTPPTICLDKISIIGENVPQPHLTQLSTPPTPTSTVSQIAARVSPTIHATADSSKPASSRDKSPKSPENKHEDSLANFFTPPYLPLLESRHERSDQIEGTQTEPASPTGRSMEIEAIRVTSSSLPTESSMSKDFSVPATKRAYTSPSTLNRKTLPPIIRNVNGRHRSGGKRKHVTFQLADRAIVEPSSSYEEGPSPDLDDENDRRSSSSGSDMSQCLVDNDSIEAARPTIARKPTPLDPFGRRKRQIVPEDTPEADVGMNMGDLLFGTDRELHQVSPPIVTTTNSLNRRTSVQGNENTENAEADGYFSPRHSTFSPISPSPEKSTAFGSVDDNAYMTKQKNKISHQRIERKNSRSPSHSPAASRQTSFDDGTSPNPPHQPTQRLAAQKLESPHFSPRHSPGHSPRQSPRQTFRSPRLVQERAGFIEDDLLRGTSNMGFFELDEELYGPAKPLGHFIEEDKEELAALENRSKKGRHTYDVSSEMLTGTSVPINIVRPGNSSVSNSWIGTFGH